MSLRYHLLTQTAEVHHEDGAALGEIWEKRGVSGGLVDAGRYGMRTPARKRKRDGIVDTEEAKSVGDDNNVDNMDSTNVLVTDAREAPRIKGEDIEVGGRQRGFNVDEYGEVNENRNDGTDKVDPKVLQQGEHLLEDNIAALKSSSTKSKWGEENEDTNSVIRNTRGGPGSLVNRTGFGD